MMLAEVATVNWTLITFLVYVAGVLALAGVAHYFAKRKAFLKEYFLGSRGLGVWAFAMTYAATSSSGGSFTGFPSLIYTYGWVLALWIAMRRARRATGDSSCLLRRCLAPAR